MLRPLFVTGSLVHGGAERNAIIIMNRLAERGHDCHAVYIKNDSSQLDLIHLTATGTVRCLNATRYLDTRAVVDLARHISDIRPSVIIARNEYALMYSSLARLLGAHLRVPVVATFHTTQLLNAKEHLKLLIDRPFFWTADRLVFVCEKQRQYWLRRGVWARKNLVIYNGVDTDHFCDRSNPESHRTLRHELGFAESDYVIGISAVLRPEKNHVQLVAAAAALRGMGVPVRVLMIGDGPMRGTVEALARELKIDGDVCITGLQKDVRPYLSACDVFVICSTAVETFSLAALEAMAMGKPVIHSELSGAAEMIVPGYNGFLFPVGDTEALVNRLSTLTDRALAKQLGDHARLMVETNFSGRRMVDRFEQLLQEVCHKPHIAAIDPVRDTPL